MRPVRCVAVCAKTAAAAVRVPLRDVCAVYRICCCALASATVSATVPPQAQLRMSKRKTAPTLSARPTAGPPRGQAARQATHTKIALSAMTREHEHGPPRWHSCSSTTAHSPRAQIPSRAPGSETGCRHDGWSAGVGTRSMSASTRMAVLRRC